MASGPNEQSTGVLGFVRRTRVLVYVLYALLAISVLVTLTGVPMLEQAVREGRRSRATLMIAPALLGLFILLFAFYRYVRVRAGKYPAGKALVQVGLMLLVLTLLLPQSVSRWRSAGLVHAVGLERLLAAPEAEERAVAAELARYRPRADALRYVPQLLILLEDPAPEVRRQAHESLVALAGGRDAGGKGAGAAARWRAYWKSQGVDSRGR